MSSLFLPIKLCLALFLLSCIARADNAADLTQAADTTHPARAISTRPIILSLPKPQHSPLERNLFWSSWWSYHGAFIFDFTMTGLILNRGGWETDPVYTQFGDKNMAGVIGSGLAVHAAASIISYELYKAALKQQGAWRFILQATALGINSYFVGIHTYAAISNVDVYHRITK
ncbi:MAG TPA: hypothetical protein VF335_05810 [Chitinivibrionales bacterium]